MKDVTNNPIFAAAKALSPRRRVRPGFTLVELLVVISIIALAVSIVLPSMIGLFSAGADKQARTMLATMCGAARGRAIENQTYTAVWMQVDKNAAHPRCWVAVLELDKALVSSGAPPTFIPSTIAPRQIPGDMAYGQISNSSVFTDGSVTPNVEAFCNVITAPSPVMPQIALVDLATAVLIFGPDGQLTNSVYGQTPRYGNKYAFKLVNSNANIQLDMANSRILWNADLTSDVLPTANSDGTFTTWSGNKSYISPSQLSQDANTVRDAGILPDPIVNAAGQTAADNASQDHLDTPPWRNSPWAWTDPAGPVGNNTYVWGVASSGACYTFRVMPPISAVTVFHYPTVAVMASGNYKTDGSRSKYLTDGKTYIKVNPYTGQLLPNE